ncbi:MAG TPA: helix-turn-helix domain-containing protein [Verrucomicrobiota bacterium]|nr:helix-turn-helix domain-containing protein [Verrucomicrobiota bacterium]
MSEGSVSEVTLLAFLLEEVGGKKRAIERFVEHRIRGVELGSWTDMEELAREEGWLPWLMEAKLADLVRIIGINGCSAGGKVGRFSSSDRETLHSEVLEIVRESGRVRCREVASRLGVESKRAAAVLRELRKKGLVRVEGKRAQAVYELAPVSGESIVGVLESALGEDGK